MCSGSRQTDLAARRWAGLPEDSADTYAGQNGKARSVTQGEAETLKGRRITEIGIHASSAAAGQGGPIHQIASAPGGAGTDWSLCPGLT